MEATSVCCYFFQGQPMPQTVKWHWQYVATCFLVTCAYASFLPFLDSTLALLLPVPCLALSLVHTLPHSRPSQRCFSLLPLILLLSTFPPLLCLFQMSGEGTEISCNCRVWGKRKRKTRKCVRRGHKVICHFLLNHNLRQLVHLDYWKETGRTGLLDWSTRRTILSWLSTQSSWLRTSGWPSICVLKSIPWFSIPWFSTPD